MATLDTSRPDTSMAEKDIAVHKETTVVSASQKTAGFKELIKNRRVVGYCMLLFILAINFGYELALVGNILAIPGFLDRFGITLPSGVREIRSKDQQILNGSTNIGIFLAAFTTGYISDLLGRKKVILLGCSLCIIGIVVQAIMTDILVLFGGKLIATFGYGMGHALGPVFVAEIAPDELRGTCLTLVNTMIVVGQWSCALVGYAGTFIKGDWGWRMPVVVQFVPPVLMILLATPLLPESPSWLLMKGRREDAAKSLRKFNGPGTDVDTALAVMEAAVEKERQLNSDKSSYLDCFKGTNRRRTTIVCVVYLAQQFVGANFVAGYLPYFFSLAGVDNAVGVAQICYAVQLLGNICSWFVVERVGRQPLLVYGNIVMTALLLLIGGLSTINTKPVLTGVVALMALWGFIFQMTLGAVAYAVGGETATPRLRQKTYSINVMSNTSAATLIGQIVPLLINASDANLGGKVAFVFFGLSVPFCIYLFFCFPEMKGRSYLELEEMFQKRVPTRDFKKYQCALEIYDAPGEKPIAVAKEDLA